MPYKNPAVESNPRSIRMDLLKSAFVVNVQATVPSFALLGDRFAEATVGSVVRIGSQLTQASSLGRRLVGEIAGRRQGVHVGRKAAGFEIVGLGHRVERRNILDRKFLFTLGPHRRDGGDGGSRNHSHDDDGGDDFQQREAVLLFGIGFHNGSFNSTRQHVIASKLST